MDFYFVDNGTMEVSKCRRAYQECLLPKLLPHQRVMLVPMVAADNTTRCEQAGCVLSSHLLRTLHRHDVMS